MEDVFGWLRELVDKPVAICLACRRAYFPHLGGCDFGCAEKLSDFTFYNMMLHHAQTDKMFPRRQKK